MDEKTAIQEAAAALGRIRTAKKAAASKQNLIKARKSIGKASAHERAKKAAAARWSKAKADGKDGRKVD